MVFCRWAAVVTEVGAVVRGVVEAVLGGVVGVVVLETAVHTTWDLQGRVANDC